MGSLCSAARKLSLKCCNSGGLTAYNRMHSAFTLTKAVAFSGMIAFLAGCATHGDLTLALPADSSPGNFMKVSALEIEPVEVKPKQRISPVFSFHDSSMPLPPGYGSSFRCGVVSYDRDSRVAEFYRKPHVTFSFQGEYKVWVPIEGKVTTYLQLRMED